MRRLVVCLIAAVMSVSLCACMDYESPGEGEMQEADEIYNEQRQKEQSEEEELEQQRYIEQAMEYAADHDPDAISYYDAYNYIGEHVTVYGVLESYDDSSAGGDPVFVDVGEAYPGTGRVTGVIWPEHVSDFSFVEGLVGEVVYIEGTLYENDGIANIELTDSSQIRAVGDGYED